MATAAFVIGLGVCLFGRYELDLPGSTAGLAIADKVLMVVGVIAMVAGAVGFRLGGNDWHRVP
ncbi:hypothetical protein [Paraburkholderia youngii]|uniref:hypothetical protein n=1 Tax=Paraburkholderia youngii TaxID=2782701 RepID=UPI003D25AF44